MNNENTGELARLTRPLRENEAAVKAAGFAPDYEGSPLGGELYFRRGLTFCRLVEAAAIASTEPQPIPSAEELGGEPTDGGTLFSDRTVADVACERLNRRPGESWHVASVGTGYVVVSS